MERSGQIQIESGGRVGRVTGGWLAVKGVERWTKVCGLDRGGQEGTGRGTSGGPDTTSAQLAHLLAHLLTCPDAQAPVSARPPGRAGTLTGTGLQATVCRRRAHSSGNAWVTLRHAISHVRVPKGKDPPTSVSTH